MQLTKLILILGLATSSSYAAIALDSSSGTFVASGNLSFKDTVVASGCMCYVCFANEGTAAPTTATFDGNNMTLVSSSVVYDYTYLYKYANPGTGAKTIAVTWTNTNPAAAASICFTGANTTTDKDAVGRGTGTTSPTSDSVAVNVANEATVDCIFSDPEFTTGPTQTGGQKIIVNINDAVNGQAIAMSSATWTTTGTKTLTYTFTGTSIQWTALSQSIAVAAGGTTYVPRNMGMAIKGGETKIMGGETKIQ